MIIDIFKLTLVILPWISSSVFSPTNELYIYLFIYLFSSFIFSFFFLLLVHRHKILPYLLTYEILPYLLTYEIRVLVSKYENTYLPGKDCRTGRVDPPALPLPFLSPLALALSPALALLSLSLFCVFCCCRGGVFASSERTAVLVCLVCVCVCVCVDFDSLWGSINYERNQRYVTLLVAWLQYVFDESSGYCLTWLTSLRLVFLLWIGVGWFFISLCVCVCVCVCLFVFLLQQYYSTAAELRDSLYSRRSLSSSS